MHRPLGPLLWHGLVMATFMVLGSSCGPRVQDPGPPSMSTGTTSTGGADATSESDGASGTMLPPPDCDAPEVACGQECVDLQWDSEHCGRCDNYCGLEGAKFGQCHEGRCTSTLSPCVTREEVEEIGTTCEKICVHFGMECEDRDEPAPYSGAGGCVAGYWYLFESAHFCDEGYRYSAPCTEEITWDRTGVGDSRQSDIRCCCKREW